MHAPNRSFVRAAALEVDQPSSANARSLARYARNSSGDNAPRSGRDNVPQKLLLPGIAKTAGRMRSRLRDL